MSKQYAPQHLASIPQTPCHLRASYAEQVAAMHLSRYGLVSATSSNANNQPYDLIFDFKGKLFKVQVKSKMPTKGKRNGIDIKTTTGAGKHYYNDYNIDLFFVLATDEHNGEMFWLFPARETECNKTKMKMHYGHEYCYKGFLKPTLLQDVLNDCVTWGNTDIMSRACRHFTARS